MPPQQVNDLLDRMLDPVGRSLTPEVARQLVDLRADPVVQQRVDELADRCTGGTLSADERAEYEAYVAAATLIAVLQSKARAVLAGGAAA
jgi:hypothetical protein